MKSYEIIANILCSSSSDYYELQLFTSSLPACKLFHLCPDLDHLRNLEPYKVTVFTRIMKSHKQSDGLLWFGGVAVGREKMWVWFSLQTCPPECCQK